MNVSEADQHVMLGPCGCLPLQQDANSYILLKTLRFAVLCCKAAAACLSLLLQALLLVWPGPAPLQASQI